MAEEKKNEMTTEVSEVKSEKKAAKKANKPKKQHFRLIRKLGHFLKDCKSEMGKVVWYGKKPTFHNSLIVLVTMLVVGAVVTALDVGLLALIKKLAEII